VEKGGQNTIVIDIHRRYPRAYIHQHSLQTPVTRPRGFMQEGPSKVYNLCNKLAMMVINNDNEEHVDNMVSIKNLIDGSEYMVPIKKIYSMHPHITVDNHFSGKNVMNL
jgi:hypothetical protein